MRKRRSITYSYNSINDNKTGKKRIAGILFVLLVIVFMSTQKPEDVIYKCTTYILPELTYEAENGIYQKDYSASYEIPEWFYEDEGSSYDNADLAVMDNDLGDDKGGSGDDGATSDLKTGTVNGQTEAGKEGISDDKNDASKEALAYIANKSVGTTYTRKQLSKPDFLTSKIFVVDNNTSMTKEELDIKNLLDSNMAFSKLPDASGQEGVQYKVLIYHTHASESFADSRPGVIEDTVVGVGSYLTKLLSEQYGIPTYHDETIYDVIDGQLDRSKAYENSFNGISKILADNPSIEVVIDLHRDGIDEETHLVTEVNGKPTAKIMFLNGVSRSDLNGDIGYLENPNKLSNLAFSFQLYLAGKEAYGDYVRKIYVRSLRYNLHVMPKAALIEAGAQNNTLEEEMNAMEPLAAMLDKVLRNPK